MGSLDIPDSEFAKLKRIAQMPGDKFGLLLAAFREARPAISLRRFAQNLKTEESQDAIRDILTVTSALFSIRDRDSIGSDDLATLVVENVKEERPKEFAGLEDVLKARLRQLLSYNPIGITAKASDVLTEHQRTFCHARVLSDIRPIFSPDFKSCDGAVIVHMLQLGYREGGEHKEFYVALDTEDVEKLKQILERAEAKTQMLENVIEKSPMKYLKV